MFNSATFIVCRCPYYIEGQRYQYVKLEKTECLVDANKTKGKQSKQIHINIRGGAIVFSTRTKLSILDTKG